MDIASPWYHRVYEKEGEKIDKYRGLKWETGKLWGTYQTAGSATGTSCWCTKGSKQKVEYMA